MNRREFLRGLTAIGCLAFAGAMGRSAIRESDARRAAERFLAARQSGDGAWRSAHYGAFRDGDALTPVVLWAMAGLDSPAIVRGRRWLEQLTDTQSAQSEPWSGLVYPLFTASYAAQFFASAGDAERAAFWVEVVNDLRIRESLGWMASDPACGAWSDSSTPPRLVNPSEPVSDMVAPNLSATVLGLQALMVTGRRDEAVTARPFVERCQNFAEANGSRHDDGGFFFAPDDPIRNKAGSTGRDGSGRMRFRSYGSATADGYLALRACGLAKDHPRVLAAASWLRRCGEGQWSPGRTAARESLAFYYRQAFASLLADLSDTPGLRSLVDDLITRQGRDGSWQGAASASCEDDPLLATAFALRALRASDCSSLLEL